MASNIQEENRYVQIHVEGNASEAIKLWEKLIEEEYMKRVGKPVFVLWSGEIDLDPYELGLRIGRILGKMGVSILTLKHPIDAVEELKGEWMEV